jgi:hypothetical protein
VSVRAFLPWPKFLPSRQGMSFPRPSVRRAGHDPERPADDSRTVGDAGFAVTPKRPTGWPASPAIFHFYADHAPKDP